MSGLRMFLELRECKARSNSVSEQSFCLHRVIIHDIKQNCHWQFYLKC